MNQISFVEPKLQVLERTYWPEPELLQKLLYVMFDPPSFTQLYDFCAKGVLECYKVGDGLILIETANWRKGRELSIYGMVGRGILRQGKAIVEDLKLLAKYKGCNMIGGEGIPKGWQRAAPSLGFEPVSTHYMMELD